MPRTETVPTHKCIVQCVSVVATGRCRVGRHWPIGASEAELTDDQIATLKGDVSYEYAPGKRADKSAAIKRPNFVVEVVQKDVGTLEVVRPDSVPALTQPAGHYAVAEAQAISRAALDRVEQLSQTLEAERRSREQAEAKSNELASKLAALLNHPGLSSLLASVPAPKGEEERLPVIPTAEELVSPAASPAKPKSK